MSLLYVEKLEAKLLSGTSLLPADFREKQRHYLLSMLQPIGAFTGRMGGIDPYYTAFGLRTADLLQIAGDFWAQNGERLFSWPGKIENIIDCYSLLAQIRVIERNLKTKDGQKQKDKALCYLRSLHYWQGIYQEFLIMLSFGMLGEKSPRPSPINELMKLQHAQGGFCQRDVDNAGLNPTAAAVAMLCAHNKLDDEIKEKTSNYLSSLQQEGGGCFAHQEAPESDLLSTFTALVAAIDMDSLCKLRLGDIGRFIKSLQAPAGGFHATTLDTVADLEYTFYGIGTLALLATIVKEKKEAKNRE